MEVLDSVDDVKDWLIRNDASGLYEALIHIEGGALESFLVAFARFVVNYGVPDFPGVSRPRPDALGHRSELLAIWDFDYYQLSLRVEEIQGGPSLVVAKHRQGSTGRSPFSQA